MKIYISGPISATTPDADREERKARFFRCSEFIKRTYEHMEPVNPLEVEACTDRRCGGPEASAMQGVEVYDHSWECWIRYDLKALLECDAIVFLPYYEISPGAMLELTVAQSIMLNPFFANERGEFIL
jgi:hypothetical protein